jgi:hypothetical protein
MRKLLGVTQPNLSYVPVAVIVGQINVVLCMQQNGVDLLTYNFRYVDR